VNEQSLERGAIFDAAGITCPLTVEELAGLIEHLPWQHEDIRLRGAAWYVGIVLDQLMRAADGLAPDVYLAETLRSESAVIALAIHGWIRAVRFSNVPRRVQHLRDALWLEDVTRSGIRDVRFVFDDSHWEHERNVPVAGDPFWHRGRLWTIQYATAEHDDVSREVVRWTVCRERPAPEPSIQLAD
jgi:hypothetical protein